MRDNWHAAVIASVVSGAFGGKPIEISKLLYKDGETRRDEEDAETLAFLDSLKGTK